jgi:REP element-mobilizing transposase RayT
MKFHRHANASVRLTADILARLKPERYRTSAERARESGGRRIKYPPVLFTGLQARAVATGFHRAATEGGYPIHACAILDDHAHLVLGRHDRLISQIVAHLKARATQQLSAEGLHPLARYSDKDGATPTPWARKYWKVFIDRVGWVRNAIDYVNGNPEKEGKRRQHWKMIVPFLG